MGAKHNFSVGDRHENHKGVYEVISIDGDRMVIRWDTGEEIETSIELQAHILRRISRAPTQFQLELDYSLSVRIPGMQVLQPDACRCDEFIGGSLDPKGGRSFGINAVAATLGALNMQGGMSRHDSRTSYHISDFADGMRISVRLEGDWSGDNVEAVKKEGTSVLQRIAANEAARRGRSIKPIVHHDVMHAMQRDASLRIITWLGVAFLIFSR
jgi:hypothetical protein